MQGNTFQQVGNLTVNCHRFNCKQQYKAFGVTELGGKEEKGNAFPDPYPSNVDKKQNLQDKTSLMYYPQKSI